RRRSSVSSPPDNCIGISRTISRISSWCARNVSVRRSADQKLTSRQRYPFPHSQNAKRSARGAMLFRHTVILNVEGQAIALTCQSYLDLRSVGVPRDVSQGLQAAKPQSCLTAKDESTPVDGQPATVSAGPRIEV